jgi:hypothetical protein
LENDVVRQEYRKLTDDEKLAVKTVKGIGQNFIDACNFIGDSRELSLAVTNMEQAVMWAVKHITA